MGIELDAEFDIEDFHTPEPEKILGLIQNIERRLKHGQNIVLYCDAGEGRSGMVVEALMRYLQVPEPRHRIRLINKRYVENWSQELFLEAFSDAATMADILSKDSKQVKCKDTIMIELMEAWKPCWQFQEKTFLGDKETPADMLRVQLKRLDTKMREFKCSTKPLPKKIDPELAEALLELILKSIVRPGAWEASFNKWKLYSPEDIKWKDLPNTDILSIWRQRCNRLYKMSGKAFMAVFESWSGKTLKKYDPFNIGEYIKEIQAVWAPIVFQDELNFGMYSQKHASWMRMYKEAACLLDPESMPCNQCWVEGDPRKYRNLDCPTGSKCIGSKRINLNDKGLRAALQHPFTKASAGVLNRLGYKVKVPAVYVDGIEEVG